MNEIYGALANVMADVDHVAKRDKNEQQRFLFRGIDAVVNAVGPILRKHQVIVVPNVENVAYEQLPMSNGKQATSCRVIAEYVFYATDGSSIATKVAGEAFDFGDKATPKAMSVCFRTALLQALALPTDEPDPDASSYEQSAPAQRPQTRSATGRMRDAELVTEAQLSKLAVCASELGLTTREMGLAYYADVIKREVGSSKELTKAEASKCIDAMTAELDAIKNTKNEGAE